MISSWGVCGFVGWVCGSVCWGEGGEGWGLKMKAIRICRVFSWAVHTYLGSVYIHWPCFDAYNKYKDRWKSHFPAVSATDYAYLQLCTYHSVVNAVLKGIKPGEWSSSYTISPLAWVLKATMRVKAWIWSPKVMGCLYVLKIQIVL